MCENLLVITLVKPLDYRPGLTQWTPWKLHFPLKGKSRQNDDLRPFRFSLSPVILGAFHPQYEVIFPACGCGSFRHCFISLPAGREFSGRRSSRCPGSASLSAAGERSSRRWVAEDAALCFLCVRRECKRKNNKETTCISLPPPPPPTYILHETEYVLHLMLFWFNLVRSNFNPRIFMNSWASSSVLECACVIFFKWLQLTGGGIWDSLDWS